MSNSGDSKSSQFDKAKKYLEQMREMGATANKNAVILLAALVVIWLSGLEPVMNEIQATEKEIKPELMQLSQLKETTNTLESSKYSKNSDEFKNRIENKNIKTKDIQKKIKEKFKDIPFKLPLFDSSLPAYLAPLVWLTLMSGLIFYLAYTRSAMLSLYARAVQELPNSNSLDPDIKERLTRAVGILPLWLAPFPHLRKGSSQSKVVLFLIYLFLLLRVIQICLKIIQVETMGEKCSDPASFFLSFSSCPDWLRLDVLLAIISAILFVWGLWRWFTPWQYLDDSLKPGKSSYRQNAIFRGTRRKIIAFTALVIITGGSLVVLSKISQNSPKNLRINPRFVMKKKAPPFVINELTPQEFYFNPKKKIIHYVLDDKTILSINQTDFPPNENAWKEASKKRWQQTSHKLQDLSLENSTTPHVHLSSASFSFEQAAIESLKNKNDKQACQLLLDGIKHDLLFQIVNPGRKPSFRLYDLLAGLKVRYQQDEYFNNMIALIKNNPQFESRIRKWNDKNSSWYKRWEDRKKKINLETTTIKWKATIMKPKKLQDSKKIERTITSIDL